MSHPQNNQPEGDHRSEKGESKADRVEAKAENRERGEAGKHIADGDLNKDIQASTLEKRLNRKSGATGYGVASADSLLPTEAEIQKMGKQLTAQLEQEKPVAIIAQNIGDNNPFHPQPGQVATDATTAPGVPSSTKTEKDIGKLSQAYGVDYSLEHARQKAQEEYHKRFDGKDAKTNDEFLDMFLNGSGNDRQLHIKRGDPILEEFIKSPGAQAMRDQYLKLGCPESTTKLGYGTKEAFIGTVAKPVADSLTHGFTDLFDEKHLGSVETQVGGFGNPPKQYPWATANANRCNVDGKPDLKGDFVEYKVTNVAGANSWAYHALPDRPLEAKGPYRSIIQVFSWVEPIPSKPHGQK